MINLGERIADLHGCIERAAQAGERGMREALLCDLQLLVERAESVERHLGKVQLATNTIHHGADYMARARGENS